jgi:hypothetical protein
MMANPQPDAHWYLTTNFLQVAQGDRVWCYYGTADGDRGLVGLGTITDVYNGGDHHEITIAWDLRRTRRLLSNPLTASRVREFIHRPRSAVQNLTRHPSLCAELHALAGIAPSKR